MPTRPPVHRPDLGSHDRERGSATARGYGAHWRKFRSWFLAQSPLCADCLGEHRATTATDVHHVVKLRDAPERRFDAANCLALCAPHHAARTARGE